MKSLLNPAEAAEITALENMIQSGITATDVWTFFSAPAVKKKYGKKKLLVQDFSDVQVTLFESAKTKLLNYLDNRSNNSCEYCRRSKGQHGMSRHIEHVRGKSPGGKSPFDLSNLAIACLDCNYTKNITIDKPKIPFDIIDPSVPGFNYSAHLNYIQISTEVFHLLSYIRISKEGKRTYRLLKFRALERADVLTKISPFTSKTLGRLEFYLSKLTEEELDNDVARFLLSMKTKIL